MLETKTSKEVIKMVRTYVKENSNSNAFAYYEATLRNIVNAGVKTISELGAYNPRIAKKPVQQNLPLMGIRQSAYGYKHVEHGTDWSQKKPKSHCNDVDVETLRNFFKELEEAPINA